LLSDGFGEDYRVDFSLRREKDQKRNEERRIRKIEGYVLHMNEFVERKYAYMD